MSPSRMQTYTRQKMQYTLNKAELNKQLLTNEKDEKISR